ncbi:MAG TPA: hypothetical protein VD858_10100 [Reyranella sp.]|nr:hypothetical protein [Reyranella sp.]
MATEVLTAERRPPDTTSVKPAYSWAFRIVITLHAAAAFAQAVLAGRFLSGDFDMLRAHFINSQVVGGLAIAQLVAGILFWRPGGARGWPALASGALLAVEPIQIAAGIKRVIGLHVPLAVLLITASILFAVWAWRQGFDRRRGAI